MEGTDSLFEGTEAVLQDTDSPMEGTDDLNDLSRPQMTSDT